MAKTNEVTKTKTTKRAKTVVPENETPAERFRRVAPSRVTKAGKAISTLAKLGGSRYEFTPADVAKIFNYLDDELSAARDAFLPKEKQSKAKGFSFGS